MSGHAPSRSVAGESPSASALLAPAEWERHRRCWMAWPHVAGEWPDLDGATRAFRDVIRAVSEFEPVAVLCRPQEEAVARRSLPSEVELHLCDLDDSWLRDIGPTFVDASDGSLVGVDWRFNGWGERYPHGRDDRVARRVCSLAGTRHLRSDLCLEGGAIHFDGEGTVLTTERCLLEPSRSGGRSRAEIESGLAELLGARTVIWLEDGLVDDETDGHVDEVACFAGPGRVLLAAPAGADDPNRENLIRCRELLESSVDATGRSLEVVDLPLPAPVRDHGAWLPRSYVNFYLPNGGVIAPALGDPEADDRAAAILREMFPRRELVTVDVAPVVLGGGGIHCITQQEPVPREASA